MGSVCVIVGRGSLHLRGNATPTPLNDLVLLGLKRKPLALIKRLRKAKKEAPPMEKPAVVKTHLRNMIVVPEMIGSVVGVHSGKTFNQVEIKVCVCARVQGCQVFFGGGGF